MPLARDFMITMEELLNHKYKLEDQPEEIQKNLGILLTRINIVRAKWGKSMTSTSGLRTMEDHLRIYRQKAERAGIPFDESKVPMHSKHLKGAADDISDPKLEITDWLKANPEILEEADLYCELGNANWVHFQILPFGSYKPGGSRWFNP